VTNELWVTMIQNSHQTNSAHNRHFDGCKTLEGYASMSSLSLS